MFWTRWRNVSTWMTGPKCGIIPSMFLLNTEMCFETFASTKLNIFERPAQILMSSFLRGRTISCAALWDTFGTMDIGFFMTQSWIFYVSESVIRTLSNSFSRYLEEDVDEEAPLHI